MNGILIVVGKTLLFYFLIMIGYRIMGKREVGELSIMDLIISIFVAQLAAISIDNIKDNALMAVIPIILLVIIQIISSYLSLKSDNVRKTLDGSISVIIDRGKVNFEEMLKQRYNLDDLMVQLREKSIKSIEEVDYAILETSGKLSVFKRCDDKNRIYPLPLILDGKIDEETLMQIGKNKKWINKELSKLGTDLSDIFYAFYRNNELYIIYAFI